MLHAIGNAHIDPVWLWRWPEGLETIRATFHSVLDRMDEYPGFVFSGSSAAFYAWLRDTDPALFSRVKARVQEGRWEIVGGWWIQPDANIPCGESLVRQALYGQRFFKDAFGVTATVGYNPDTFGHAGTLPQILRQAGLTRYIFMRPGPHEKDLPGNVFWWQSPDGSRVLTARIAGSYGTWGNELLEQIKACETAGPGYVSDYIVFYGVGNHGGGPTRANIESILSCTVDPVSAPPSPGAQLENGASPIDGSAVVRLSSLDAFFRSVEAEAAAGAAIPVVADDLQHHARGCYTAESEVKRHNRRTEHLLMSAERFAAMAAAALGHTYPKADLTSAWQSLLFNQFHDILAGTSLPEGYVDARDWFGHAATLAGRALNTSIQAIGSRVDTRGPGDALLVFNPLPWEVTVPVEVECGSVSLIDADGEPVAAQSVQPTTVVGQRRSCFVAKLPALGYRLFRQDVAATSDNPLFKTTDNRQQTTDNRRQTTDDSFLAVVCRPSSGVLENSFWLLEVDPATGWLTRLFDKRRQVDVLSGPANVGVVVDDPSDTWSHEVRSYREEAGRFGDGTAGAARVAVEEDGPVRVALRIESAWGCSTMVQRLFLYRDLDLIECRASANWQEQHKMLKLAFPFRLNAPRATYDAAYGCIERTCNGEEEPGQQWVDVSGQATSDAGESLEYGVSLLNDCKYGFDVRDAELRMSVLRSPVYAHHDPYLLQGDRRYVYQDQGWQTVVYRLVPHAGAWQDAGVARRAWELNVAPLWVNEYAHPGEWPVVASFLSVEPDHLLITVCKQAEDAGDLIVRAYEAAGRAARGTIRLPFAAVEWVVEFEPHQIKTWRVGVRSGDVTEVDLLERPCVKP